MVEKIPILFSKIEYHNDEFGDMVEIQFSKKVSPMVIKSSKSTYISMMHRPHESEIGDKAGLSQMNVWVVQRLMELRDNKYFVFDRMIDEENIAHTNLYMNDSSKWRFLHSPPTDTKQGKCILIIEKP